jgi:hypothetical protein
MEDLDCIAFTKGRSIVHRVERYLMGRTGNGNTFAGRIIGRSYIIAALQYPVGRREPLCRA